MDLLGALQGLALTVSLLNYASFVWIALYYFKTDSVQGRRKRLALSTLGTISIVASWSLEFFFPTLSLTSSAIGLILFMYSALVFWWAYVTVREIRLDFAFSERASSSLIIRGPYKFVRHPFYSSYMASWLGACFCSGFPLLALVPIVMGSLYYYAAREEENFFRSGPLGATYESYMSSTFRFIPVRKYNGQENSQV